MPASVCHVARLPRGRHRPITWTSKSHHGGGRITDGRPLPGAVPRQLSHRSRRRDRRHQRFIDAGTDRCAPFTWTKALDIAIATQPRNRKTQASGTEHRGSAARLRSTAGLG